MKKIFLLSLVCFMASYTWALTSITTGKIMGSPFCGGSTNINVPYTVDAPANSGNVFTAQLSDENGSFATPTNIGTLTATGSGTVIANIPLGTKTGTGYRIRVVSSNPVVNGSANTKDLKINPKPSGTSVTGATACAATLNWKSTGTASSYKTRYKKSSDPNSAYTGAVSVGNVLSYTFTGLNSNISYDFEVRAVCANGELSDWKKQSGSTIACPVPTGGTVTAYTPSTTTLDWNDMACATGYRIRYKYLGDPSWEWYTTSTASTKVLTGLLPGTDYEAQVATLCGSDSGGYSLSIMWETPYIRLLSPNENASNVFNVFPNPSDGEFTIEFNSMVDNSPIEITIQNVYGQTAYTANRFYNKGLNEEKISIPNASSGLYLVRVKSGDEVFESSVMVK